MARTRQQTWKPLSLVAALGLGAAVACAPPEDTTPNYEGSCPILIECATVFAPGDAPSKALSDELKIIYGANGSCWENGTLQHWGCRESCVEALDAYNLLVAASGVSCGLCTDDSGCTNFGSDATCVAGYCARGQLGDIDAVGDTEDDDSGNAGGIGPLTALPQLVPECDVAAPRVAIETNYGTMVVEVDRAAEPNAAYVFLAHVSATYYGNMLFHRVVDGVSLSTGLFYDGLGLVSPVSARYQGTPSLTPSGDDLALIFADGRVSGAFYLGDGGTDGTGVVIGTIVSGLDVRDEISAVEVFDTQWMGFLLEDLPREDVLISRVYCE